MTVEPARPPYSVQGETVRGEPRYYWVYDTRGKMVTRTTTDQRQADRWCKKLLAGEPLPTGVAL
jgi:hypothetical protein